MPIQQGNIVYVASQVMDDVPEGGGAATNRVIADGLMNNVFPDISDLDRAYGRLKLRKVFVAIRSLDTDLFGGARTVITALPDDPALGYCIFTTDSPFDTRQDVAARVEAYLFGGPEWGGYLLEDHLAGQQTIQLFQRPGAIVPVPGQTLVLIFDEGKSSEQLQYVRITRATAETRTFTFADNNSYVDYQAQLVACELSDALRYDFPGSSPSRTYARDASKTKIRDTVVADAARYYGSTTLAADAAIGDLNIDVASIWSQLVPSAQTDLPLADVTPNGEVLALMPTSAASVVFATSVAFGPANALHVGPFLPGSLSLGVGAVTLTDRNGRLYNGSTEVGSVDYANGVLTIAMGGPSYAGSKTITIRPAASPAVATESWSVPVTAESRSATLAMPLQPVPAPGTLTLAYMAQGNWYVLRDQGTGSVTGSDPGQGVGTLSFVTGTLSVTLGALPDVGSEILLGWSVPQLTAKALAPHTVMPWFELDLAGPVWPGSLSIQWLEGATTRTVTDNGTGGLTGYGSGTIDYATGLATLTPTTLPSPTTAWNATWRETSDDIRPPARADVADFADAATAFQAALPDAGVVPGSFSAEVALLLTTSKAASYYGISDDGVGGLRLALGSGYVALPGSSINYSTGALVLDKDGNGLELPVPWSAAQTVSRVLLGAA